MSEKRFEFYSDEDLIGVLDTVTGKTFNSFEIVDKLNEQSERIKSLEMELDLIANTKLFSRRELERKVDEQQATIQQLQAKLREKEEDERLYANEILELRETNKEHIKFKSLGGNY